MTQMKEQNAISGLVEASMYLGDSYATGFIHQAAWDDYNRLIFARIAGRPAFVRAMTAGLLMNKSVLFKMSEGTKYFRGDDQARSIYNRLDKDVGVATFFSKQLFSTDGPSSFIVGKEKAFLNETFYKLLRRKAIIYHEEWNFVKVYTELGFLKEIDGFGLKGYEISWMETEVNKYIGNLVRERRLSFKTRPARVLPSSS